MNCFSHGEVHKPKGFFPPSECFFFFFFFFFGNQRRFDLDLKGLDYDIVAKYVSCKSLVPDFLRMFDCPQKT